MSDKEKSAVWCTAVEEMDDPVGGSTVAKCVKCGKDVWLSPSGAEMVEKHDADIICGAHTDALLTKWADLQDEQIAELRRIGHTDADIEQIRMVIEAHNKVVDSLQ